VQDWEDWFDHHYPEDPTNHAEAVAAVAFHQAPLPQPQNDPPPQPQIQYLGGGFIQAPFVKPPPRLPPGARMTLLEQSLSISHSSGGEGRTPGAASTGNRQNTGSSGDPDRGTDRDTRPPLKKKAKKNPKDVV